ncbi:MAG: sensor histidine kinase [Paucimonas sp.]|nr:sensor histidine kinase [Paucimonas sp.]
MDVFAAFIRNNIDQIIGEWEVFARTQAPAADAMSKLALRDHSKHILIAIANDLEREQSESQREAKSRGDFPPEPVRETAAATHGALRHASGFTLVQLNAEFRALRASVMRLWMREPPSSQGAGLAASMLRFNEAIDQAVAESISSYEARMTQARDMYLAILGHDLRSPLSAITAVGEILTRTGTADDPAAGVVRILQSSVAVMGAMIDDLIEYSRSKLGGELPLVRKQADVAEIFSSSAEEVKIAHPDVTISVLESPGDCMMAVDPVRLRQAISNVLNNAVQHGDRSREIKLSMMRQADSVEFHIRNYGAPIPEERISTMFDPFYSISDGRSDEKRTHLGLGLYIARSVAQAHGGDLRAAPAIEEGALFVMTIPVVAG